MSNRIGTGVPSNIAFLLWSSYELSVGGWTRTSRSLAVQHQPGHDLLELLGLEDDAELRNRVRAYRFIAERPGFDGKSADDRIAQAFGGRPGGEVVIDVRVLAFEFDVEERAVLLAAEDVGVARAAARRPAIDCELDANAGSNATWSVICAVSMPKIRQMEARDRTPLSRTRSYVARSGKITSNVILSTPAFLLRIVLAISDSLPLAIISPPR